MTEPHGTDRNWASEPSSTHARLYGSASIASVIYRKPSGDFLPTWGVSHSHSATGIMWMGEPCATMNEARVAAVQAMENNLVNI